MDEATAREEYGYLTTQGRRSGRPHTVEIWFALHEGRFWLIAGGGDAADWVRNLQAQPAVRFRVGGTTFDATAETVPDEAASRVPRRLLAAKYQHWREGQELSDWAARGLAVAVTPQESRPR
jgi:deazaflavin-dependent oxidoreductase (nitroreductase family)